MVSEEGLVSERKVYRMEYFFGERRSVHTSIHTFTMQYIPCAYSQCDSTACDESSMACAHTTVHLELGSESHFSSLRILGSSL